MAKDLEVSFKTLLTKSEYIRLAKLFASSLSDLQTNYYFDTSRFTLKASDVVLRVRERDQYEIALRRKKGYNKVEIVNSINKEEFDNFMTNAEIPSLQIQDELSELIKGQKLVCYMTISTYRIFTQYKKGYIAIDKCTYFDVTDYELEYTCYNKEQGKKEFVEMVKEFGIAYKKCDTKIMRAYEALKRQ